MLDNIVDERKSLEIEALKKIEREDKCLADQRAFELEKLKLQAQNPPASVGNSSQMDSNPMRLDLKTVLPTFIPDKDDISLFLTMNTGNPEFRKSHSFKVEKNVSGNHNSAFANPSYMPARNTNTGFHPPISCYGCGNPGFIKSKCPKCSQKKESASVNAIHMFTCLTSPVALLDIEVYEATGTVCVDTGASQSLGGELMFKFLRNRGQKFSEFHLAMCLADGNRTLLGVDFLRTSGIVMDMRNNFWYFGDKPSFRIPFSKDVPLPVDDSPVEINSSSCPPNSIPSEIPLHSNTVDETETNNLHLREEEGQALNVEERNDLMLLLNESDHPPVSTAPYRLSPNRKEHLRKEIDNLLAHNIIEECESPYAAPVVLVPKSNGTVRLCIDYRKLNAITIPDKYPLPLMDVLLHDAKSTAFMSTLDLKSGYHQVRGQVNGPRQECIRLPFCNLSKKSTAWKWSDIEQQAFQTLKQCLITSPILRQVDPKKPFIIRTDASSYALGAVLLQGESPTDEQPVEYASRLLSSAEKNYSTTEREALAIVWALNKFRGYIGGAEITVASDHQPLKWLMNLTSPTGRLARWALQIQ
ncbi:retrovirus-related Pol polyprotein from transposon 297 [Trichonephila clavipes]|nr:retrovirus-related Pol polyprotein from transposon 297 [Trichonephila clavipes]